MTQQELYINLPRRILNKIKGVMGTYDDKHPTAPQNGFNTYFDGEPFFIAASQLPALIVDWQRIDPASAPTGMDKWSHNIVIKVVLNKMDDAGVIDIQGGNGDIIETPTKKRLENYLFARDATTGEYLTKTIYGVIRKYFTMDGGEITQSPIAELGESNRPSNEGGTVSELPTSEAHVTITAQELIEVQPRS